MRLYEISQQYIDFLSYLDANPDLPPEAIADTLEAIEGEFDLKADNIACIIKDLDAEAAAIKAEEAALKERRIAKENRADRLREYLAANMQKLGKSKLETARNVIGFRKSTSVEIKDEETFKQNFPQYCRTKIEIAKSEIAKLLKSGIEVEGAELRENQNLYVK